MPRNPLIFQESQKNILTAAGMVPNPDDDGQVLKAIQYLLGQAIATRPLIVSISNLPTSDRGPVVVAERAEVWNWVSNSSYSGYRSPDCGLVDWFAGQVAPVGYLKANGAAVAVAAYGGLAAAIYCGDALNATALFGYRCTDPVNPSTSRTTTGAYIVLPDLRGEFVRGWDDRRGIDVDRAFGSWQPSMFANHSHTQQATSGTGGNLTAITFGATNAAVTSASNVPTVTTGGNETRPRNVALLACIKF